jgi:hypothetical protein
MGTSSTDSQNAEEDLWTIDRRSEGKSKVDKDHEATERHRSHANNSPQSSSFGLTAWTSSAPSRPDNRAVVDEYEETGATMMKLGEARQRGQGTPWFRHNGADEESTEAGTCHDSLTNCSRVGRL